MAAAVTQGQTTSSQPGQARPRRYELDWLRAFVVLGLIPIHAAVIFSTTADVFVKNAQTSTFMSILGVFAGTWGMPLLFVVAGASACFALQYRSAGGYLHERTLRLIVPFAFATLTLIPIQVYGVLANNPTAVQAFGLPIHDPNFTRSPFSFYVEYLRGYGYFLTHFSPSLVIVFWGHLWFIPRLIAYALLTLPLFLYLRGKQGRKVMAAVGGFLSRPGLIFVPIVPLALVEMSLRPGWMTRLSAHWPIYDDWVQFAFFLLYFIFGYVLYADERLLASIRRHGWIALVLGIVGFAFALTRSETLTTNALNYSLGYVAGVPIRSFVSWFWVVAILAFGMRFLAFTNGLLRYVNEAAYPIYIIHMPIVTIIGVYVVQLDINLYVKFAIIITLALILALGAYEFLIRRIRILRHLFGLKPAKSFGASHTITPSSGALTSG